MGRIARGVRGIRLIEGDEVCGVAVVEEGKKLLVITEGGFGKRTDFDDFRRMAHRGGRGVACQKVTEKTGEVASVCAVSDEDDVMLIGQPFTSLDERFSKDVHREVDRASVGIAHETFICVVPYVKRERWVAVCMKRTECFMLLHLQA